MGRDTQRDTLSDIANAVLEHLHVARAATSETDFLVALPTYLDATDVHFLQLEVNRWSTISIQLQHRPGERRVGVRLHPALCRR
jgi:hypothetical protein